jgi:hypothetical protein
LREARIIRNLAIAGVSFKPGAGFEPAIQPLNQLVKNWMPGLGPGKTWF